MLNNPLPEKIEKNDVVLVTGEAIWIRSGSDKLPWKEVPPSRRSAAQIPINVLGVPLFDELMEGGKVLEVMGAGQSPSEAVRVKVRNQRTARTSVFFVTDVRLLRRGGE